MTLVCTCDLKSQIINDRVTIMAIHGDHVLVNEPRVLVYPALINVSGEIANLNDELIGKKVNVLMRVYKHKVEYLELKMSSKIPQNTITIIDELLRNRVKYFLLDEPDLRGLEYFDFSYSIKIGFDSSK
ncbi:MAG: hypothetical protein ACJAXX_001795 [Roseivirga sp.]|jgi:hypothetical protein